MTQLTAFASPALLARPVSPRRAHCTTRCSATPVTRRQALRLASLAAATTLLRAAPARSESTYEKNVRLNVEKVAAGREKALALKTTAAGWKDAMDEDDMLYVLRFIPIWLEPARVALANVGTQQNVDVGDAQAVQTFAAATMGHLLELRMEAKALKKAGVVREIDEFVETADDFLKLPGVQRFIR